MFNLAILLICVFIIVVSIISAIKKIWNRRNTSSDSSTLKDDVFSIKYEILVTMASFLLPILAIQVSLPTNYSNGGGIMDSEEAVIKFGDYDFPTSVWISYDETSNPVSNGVKYTEPFIPEQSGNLYYKARFLWAESERGQFYVQTYQDRLEKSGISEGLTSEVSDSTEVPEILDVSSGSTLEPNPGPENSYISQEYMADDDNPPGKILWGWGDTSEGGQGRESFTVEDINNGLLGNRIVFNTISNSTIGNEKNFVAARAVGEDKGLYNVWNANLIEVETGGEYYIRIYGHNNSPFGYDAVANDVKVVYMLPQGSGKTIVVNGQIASSNADPDRYWDSVVFTCKDRFRLEYVEGSAILENNGIGVGGIALSDSIVNSWVNVGYEALDGRIPGCYQYDFYISIKVKAVGY